MSLTINHRFVSAKADSSDTTLINPSNWNATHTIINSSNIYYSEDYNFATLTPGGSLIVGSNTITLSSIPSGIAIGSWLYITGGTGTAESVIITGYNSTTGAAIVTCAHTHSGAWTIKSSSCGIQEAIIVAGVAGGGIIQLPTGTQIMRAPIVVNYNSIHLQGVGCGDTHSGTVLQRTEDYGDTFTVGYPGGVYDFAMTDIGCLHVLNYVAGSPPTISNKITVNTTSANLRIYGSQGSRIEHCSFWGMPYNVRLDGGAHYQIKHNYFWGVWDPSYVACQQTIANLWLVYASGEVPTDLEIEGNYFEGALSVARNRTVNATTFSCTECVGPKYMILAQNWENIHISGGIMGAAAFYNIAFQPSNLHPALGVNISNVQFDGAGNYDILFDNVGAAQTIINATISNCTFDGEGIASICGIYCTTSTTTVVSGLTISGNVFVAYIAAPIQLGAVVNCAIVGNTICAYNTQQAYNSDILNAAAIAIYGISNKVTIVGNSIGGGQGGEVFGAGVYTYAGITLFGTYLPAHTDANYTVKGNNVVSISLATDLAFYDVSYPSTLGYGHIYYIGTEGGANNAITGSLNSAIRLTAGLTVRVQLAHTLQAGANTFAYNGGTALGIKSSRNVANNIGTAYAATGAITMMYDGTRWVDVSQ